MRSACETQRNNSELESLSKLVHLIEILRDAYGETVKAKRNMLLRHNGYDAILTAVGKDQRHNEANKCVELQSCLFGVVTVVVTLGQELDKRDCESQDRKSQTHHDCDLGHAGHQVGAGQSIETPLNLSFLYKCEEIAWTRLLILHFKL